MVGVALALLWIASLISYSAAANFCEARWLFDCLGTAKVFQQRTGAANPFGAIDVGPHPARLAFLDHDGDGDLDFAIGSGDGHVLFYERVNATGFEQRTGAANPFGTIDTDSYSAQMAFLDIDEDGDLDLTIGNDDGQVQFYERVSATSFVQRTGAANPFAAIDAGYYAAPSFLDIDGDGDLDLAIGNVDGQVQFYERTGPTSFQQRTGAANPFEAIDVGYYAVPSFLDVDGDGDLDLAICSLAGQVQFYERTGATSFVQRTGAANPFDSILAGFYAALFFLDIDGDDDLDLAIGNGDGQVRLYERATAISFEQRTGAANPFTGIDMGNFAAPSFLDIDEDGDLDLAIGNQDGQVHLYERTGATSFEQRTGAANPFEAVAAGAYAVPTFLDIDGDGDLDLAIGNDAGHIVFYERINATSFEQRTGAANPFDAVHAGYFAAPSFLDVDGDGDLDLAIGNHAGHMLFYERTNATSFEPRTGAANPFEDVDVGSGAAPSFLDVDGDGDLDLAIGNNAGKVRFYERTGATSFEQRTGAANPFEAVDMGHFATPSFLDIDGDGDLDLAIGNGAGQVQYYERVPAIGCFSAVCSQRGDCLASGYCDCIDGYTGREDCGVCSPGYETASLTGAVIRCDTCAPGQYSPSSGLPCGRCAAGVVAFGGSAACESCPAGTVPNEIQSRCEACPAGAYAEEGSSSCSECTAGTFSVEGSSQCGPCSAGRFSKNSSGSCSLCEVGKVSMVGQSECSSCPTNEIPNPDFNYCISCPFGTYAEAGSQRCSDWWPALIGALVALVVIVVMCWAVRKAFQKRRRTMLAALACEIQKLEAEQDWLALYHMKESTQRDEEMAQTIDAALRKAKSESLQLGISLSFVLKVFETEFKAKLSCFEWRAGGDGIPFTKAGFGMKYNSGGESEWERASPVQCPDNPTFVQMAPVLTFGEQSYGYNCTCPRDGQLHASIVDGVRKIACGNGWRSAPATHFLSWVWNYDWQTVHSALDQWVQSQFRANQQCDLNAITLWWCFFVNNQHRILQDTTQQDTEALANTCQEKLRGVGRMLCLLDEVSNSRYASRIWCVFELFIASKNDIPCTMIFPRRALDTFKTLTSLPQLVNACSVHAENATAMLKRDEDGLKSRMIRDFGTFDAVNDVVQRSLQSDLVQRWYRNKIADGAPADPEDTDDMASKNRHLPNQVPRTPEPHRRFSSPVRKLGTMVSPVRSTDRLSASRQASEMEARLPNQIPHTPEPQRRLVSTVRSVQTMASTVRTMDRLRASSQAAEIEEGMLE